SSSCAGEHREPVVASDHQRRAVEASECVVGAAIGWVVGTVFGTGLGIAVEVSLELRSPGNAVVPVVPYSEDRARAFAYRLVRHRRGLEDRMVAAEMIGAERGIGAFVLAAGNLTIATILAGIVMLSLLGLAVSWLIGRAENLLLAWR